MFIWLYLILMDFSSFTWQQIGIWSADWALLIFDVTSHQQEQRVPLCQSWLLKQVYYMWLVPCISYLCLPFETTVLDVTLIFLWLVKLWCSPWPVNWLLVNVCLMMVPLCWLQAVMYPVMVSLCWLPINVFEGMTNVKGSLVHMDGTHQWSL